MKKVDEKFELVLFNTWMAGISARKVSKELKVNGINISHTTVARYYKKFEEEYRVNKDISHLYAIRLFDIYKAMIDQQINEYEAFGEIRDLIFYISLRSEIIRNSKQATVVTDNFEKLKKRLLDAFNNEFQSISEIIIDEEKQQFLVISKELKRGD